MANTLAKIYHETEPKLLNHYVHVLDLQPWGHVTIGSFEDNNLTKMGLRAQEPELLAWADRRKAKDYKESQIIMVTQYVAPPTPNPNNSPKVCIVYAINANG